ncbi:MAG: hypothetical protein IT317_23820 [Anaerolineales bacterium]|nr:hypothetical protein [Anaerolineales bacterium]
MPSRLPFLLRLSLPFALTLLALAACRVGAQPAAPATATAPPPIASPAATALTATAPPASTSTSPVQAAATLAPTATPTARPYHLGRNDFVTLVADTPREWLLYVPPGYTGDAPVPVVFMFHGSNQGGPLMYQNTTWAALADQHGFLVVFPTGWKYPLVGEAGLHSKWNSRDLVNEVEPGTALKDDVRFVQVMLAELQANFNVDARRVYATGFSNGGSFVLSRLIPEMNTAFAAYATAGSGLLTTGLALSDVPVVPAALYSVLGTLDEKVSERTGHALPLPIETGAMLADPLLAAMFSNTTRLLGLSLAYTSLADPAAASNTLTFDTSLSGAGNQYIFRMVARLGHVYPSGDNNRHRLDIAPEFWAFFSQYQLP